MNFWSFFQIKCKGTIFISFNQVRIKMRCFAVNLCEMRNISKGFLYLCLLLKK